MSTNDQIKQLKLKQIENQHKSQLYSKHLSKSLASINSEGVNSLLISKITLIHENDNKIDEQFELLHNETEKLVQNGRKLERFKNKHMDVILGAGDLQNHAEIVDQQIRILENCVGGLRRNTTKK